MKCCGVFVYLISTIVRFHCSLNSIHFVSPVLLYCALQDHAWCAQVLYKYVFILRYLHVWSVSDKATESRIGRNKQDGKQAKHSQPEASIPACSQQRENGCNAMDVNQCLKKEEEKNTGKLRVSLVLGLGMILLAKSYCECIDAIAAFSQGWNHETPNETHCWHQKQMRQMATALIPTQLYLITK